MAPSALFRVPATMVIFAYFGINSKALSLVVDLLILCAAIVYLALVYWTLADARRRVGDPLLVGCAFLASLVPFVGPLVYLILRPPEYLEDAHERELDIRAAEARIAELEQQLCPHCDYRVERDFLRCPSCLRKLKERCSACSRPLDPAWSICPYCETEVPGASSSRSRRRRGERSESELPPAPTVAAAEPERGSPEDRAAARARRRRERTPPRPGRHGASRSSVLSDEAEAQEGELSRDPLAPEVDFTGESLLSPEDLLGETMEADQLPDEAEAERTPMPATDAGSRRSSASRRPRRTPPTS